MPKFSLKKYLNKADLWILIALFCAVTAVFAIPAIFNRPIMPGDDVIQNFPLRIFSGEQIASFHLPLWNPYGFSGTPLLAGFNAGSLYPTTFLFAFLSPVAAWVLNEIIAYFVALSGIYILLRCYRFSQVTTVIASICFVGSGTMAIQVAHLDLIQAMSFMPWLLIVLGSTTSKLNHLSNLHIKSILSATIGEITLTSLLWGFIFLTGSTRAITDDLIIYTIFVAYVLFSRNVTESEENDNRNFIRRIPNKTRIDLALTILLALCVGIMASSLQSGLGLIFISESQRSSASIGFFNQSSPFPGWISMLFAPAILGTSQSLEGPGFFGTAITNIVEVSGYMGLLATLGFFEYSLRHRLYRAKSNYLTPFFYVALTGLFLAYIAGNLFGGIMIHIPIYGSERIQGRNLLEVDFAFTFFLAFIIEQITKNISRLNIAKYFCMGTIIFLIVAIIDPIKVTEIVGTSILPNSTATTLRPWLVAQLIVDLFILLLLFSRHKITLSKTRLIVTALLIAGDILLFNFTAVITVDTGQGQSPTVLSNELAILNRAKYLQSTNSNQIHKFVIDDPYVYPAAELVNVNWPDINVITQQFSAQGYQSLSLENYDRITQTHGNMVLNPEDFTNGILKFLDVTKAYSPPQNFNSYFPSNPNTYAIKMNPSAPSSWYFGIPTTLESFSVKVAKCSVPKAYLIDTKGQLNPVNPVSISCRHNQLSILQFNKSLKLVGVYIAGTYRSNYISDIPPKFYSYESFQPNYLNGPLSNQLYYPTWKYVSTTNEISLYTQKAQPFLRTFSKQVKISQSTMSANGTLNFNVDSNQNTMVMINQTYAPGFQATATSLTNGSVVAIKVKQDTPIQTVNIPKGKWHVRVYYMPSYVKYFVADEIFAVILILLMSSFFIWSKKSGKKSSIQKDLSRHD